MNIAKITNKIALISVIALIYWVFIFVSMEVFGFKVFRQNMTQIFGLSILGIFAILFGSLVLNIMFNLSAIAEHVKQEQPRQQKRASWWVPIVILSFPLLFGLLYWGNNATNKKRENYLISSAKILQETQRESINLLASYTFGMAYIKKSCQTLKYLGKVDENFPYIFVIQQDNINGKRVNLNFTNSCYLDKKSESDLKKVDYILGTSVKEREYLRDVFTGKVLEPLYSGNDDKFELYYPIQTTNGRFVLYLSKYSQYGKIGS